MKTRPILRTGLAGLILSVTAGIATPVFALAGMTAPMPAAGSADARKDYPLATCAISGDKLEPSKMGPMTMCTRKKVNPTASCAYAAETV